MKYPFLIPLLAISFCLSSCWWLTNSNRPYKVEKVLGYKPIFSEDPEHLKIKLEPPRKVKNAGKIYVKDQLIFQADIGAGIHVIDKTTPASLKNIGFIKVIGSSDMAVMGNTMYVNSYYDMVVLDISDWQNVKELKRMPHVVYANNGNFNLMKYMPLPEKGYYYECDIPLEKRHTIIGWYKDSVMNYCFYP